jgi:hypothetical protein
MSDMDPDLEDIPISVMIIASILAVALMYLNITTLHLLLTEAVTGWTRIAILVLGGYAAFRVEALLFQGLTEKLMESE